MKRRIWQIAGVFAAIATFIVVEACDSTQPLVPGVDPLPDAEALDVRCPERGGGYHDAVRGTGKDSKCGIGIMWPPRFECSPVHPRGHEIAFFGGNDAVGHCQVTNPPFGVETWSLNTTSQGPATYVAISGDRGFATIVARNIRRCGGQSVFVYGRNEAGETQDWFTFDIVGPADLCEEDGR